VGVGGGEQRRRGRAGARRRRRGHRPARPDPLEVQLPWDAVLVRRELPHPGATLDAFEVRDGYRYQAFTTNTRRGQLAFREARHRAHARVEDRIRTGKDTGLGHLPSRHEQINAAWVELALIAADLLAEVVPVFLELEVAVPRLMPASR
jgi:hypothetical protein